MQTEYLGIPLDYWQSLCDEAEGLMIEENIGQYILGIYPSGNRLFGLEHAPAELFCLYIDSTDKILDPFAETKSKRVIDSRNASCTFVFREFWEWISEIKHNIQFSHYIVGFSKSFYQEESVDPIILSIQNFLLNNKIQYRSCNIWEERAVFIFNKTEIFSPNINPKFGNVINTAELHNKEELKETTDFEIESNLIKRHLNGEYPRFKDSLKLISLYHFLTKKSETYDSDLNQISEQTIKFFKSLI